jgi:predicted ATPase
MLALAERALPESRDEAQAALLEPEADNIRSALDWALRHDQADLGLRLAAGAFPLWHFSGHYREGSTWLERVLSLPSASNAHVARAFALGWNGQLRLMLGDYLQAQERGDAAPAS